MEGRFGEDDVLCKATTPAWIDSLHQPRFPEYSSLPEVQVRCRSRTTQPDKPVLIAAVDETFFTCATRPIIDNRLYNASITRLVLRHAFSYFFHNSSELVAHCERNPFAGDGVGCNGE